MKNPIPAERIERCIHLVRGHRVILAADLARLYGVVTWRLNEQVKRNKARFPEDFVFQLTQEEDKALTSQFARSKPGHGGRRALPSAFTEYGTLMAANVLKSSRAVAMSVQVVRAFVRLREMLASNRELAKKLAELERKLEGHDQAIHSLFEAIRTLLNPPDLKPKKIGFHVKERTLRYGATRPIGSACTESSRANMSSTPHLLFPHPPSRIPDRSFSLPSRISDLVSRIPHQ
jgi:hypothetical protein